mmetsp:Transcript_33138/g.56286  ORF Transcript_33138/g.56286 Transcript_33138/m.56286 type:complete len:330 (-) Transcript_33138:179-1168(-)
MVLFTFDKRVNYQLTTDSKKKLSDKDKKYALDALGVDSVYQFFMGKNCVGWIIALGTVAFQIVILSQFVAGAEIIVGDDDVDLKYTWRCPQDQLDCIDTLNFDSKKWAVFGALMGIYLLKDIINGTKMTILSSKQRHPFHDRLRFFVGGLLLNSVALFTLFVSAIYIKAIATSNTEVIVNSVIILFVTDTDEQLYGIFVAINPRWVAAFARDIKGDKHDDIDGINMQELSKNFELQNKVDELTSQVNDMNAQTKKLRQEIKVMKKMMNVKGTKSLPRSPSRKISGASVKEERPPVTSEGGTTDTSYNYNAMDPNASEEKQKLSRYDIVS